MIDHLTLKNFVLYALNQGLRFIFPLIATPFLAATLKSDAFAELALVNSCLWTSTIFMDFGFYMYGISRTAGARSHDELSAVVSNISTSKLLLSPITIIVYIGLSAWSGTLTREPFGAFIALFSALAYGGTFSWYFQGRQRGLTAVSIEAIPQFIQFILMILLIRRPDQLWTVLLLQAIPPVVAIIYSVISICQSKLLHVPTLGSVKETMMGASPYFLERLCFTLYTALMPNIVLKLSGKQQVAFYSLGDRFGAVLSMLSTPLNQAGAPLIAKALHAGRESGWRISSRLLAIVTMAMIVASTVTFFAVDLLVRRFFPFEYLPAVPIAKLFCVNAVIATVGYTCTNFILVPRREAKILLWSAPAALVLGMTAQFWLVPVWGGVGAAIGRLISESTATLIVCVAALNLFLRERRDMSVPWRAGSRSASERPAAE
jgi:O-antigen/teichoic acid export membrane protein